MKRFSASLLTLAVGFAPASAALAADPATDPAAVTPPSRSLSIDFLGLTDYVSNPTDESWVSVMQQLRAHPCFNAVGDEQAWCRDRYGLSEDIRTLLGRVEFREWLHDDMVAAACGGLSAAPWVACVANVPVLTADMFAWTAADSDDDGDPETDMTTSNEALFDRAGTPPTTRQNAMEIIAEDEADDGMTQHERATLLWDWCNGSDMGRSGCFHTFQRYLDDRSVDADALRDVIMRHAM